MAAGRDSDVRRGASLARLERDAARECVRAVHRRARRHRSNWWLPPNIQQRQLGDGEWRGACRRRPDRISPDEQPGAVDRDRLRVLEPARERRSREGDTIDDRQHPHDLFMEPAADDDRPLRGSLRWRSTPDCRASWPSVRRASRIASERWRSRRADFPSWLDSSHITFGLITTGVDDQRWKAEMSVFTGEEPDDDRANLDLAPLDSISGRFSFLPTPRLAVQVSAAHLNEAEAEFAPQPRTDLNRFTASATYHRMSGENVWATTLVYGVNSGREIIPDDAIDLVTDALMLESSMTFRERQTWFGRAELVGKPAHDLHAHEYPTRVFAVGKLEAGYVRNFKTWNSIVPGIGGAFSLSIVPSELAPRYTSQVRPGFAVFVTIRPARHVM